MKKTVILDGKKRYKNQYETINLIISNQKIIGVGYLPDDEESNKINAKNHLLVPNIINFTHLFVSQAPRAWACFAHAKRSFGFVFLKKLERFLEARALQFGNASDKLPQE